MKNKYIEIRKWTEDTYCYLIVGILLLLLSVFFFIIIFIQSISYPFPLKVSMGIVMLILGILYLKSLPRTMKKYKVRVE